MLGLHFEILDEHVITLVKRGMRCKPGGSSRAAITDPCLALTRAFDAAAT
jgi:hypothetical protein